MATHPPSPLYARFAPRPPSPPCPSIPGAAAFLASYYAVPDTVPLGAAADAHNVPDKGIVSASAFLGHVHDEPASEPSVPEHEPDVYIYHDVRSSLFPGQQQFFSSLTHDRGVRGDSTWSAERGWTAPGISNDDDDEHERSKPNPPQEPAHATRDSLPAINTAPGIDLGYLTTQLGTLAMQHGPESPAAGQNARLIRRESGTHSRSLSRQSSIRRGDRVAATAGGTAETTTTTNNLEPSPMSPASAFLSHFSPQMQAHSYSAAAAAPHAIHIQQSQTTGTDPGDVTTSEFSLSRIGSPSKYGSGGQAGDQGGLAGLGVASGKVFAPMGVMVGSPGGGGEDEPTTRRSFSSSVTGSGWLPAHLAALGGQSSNMTMSTLSTSSGISHHSGSSTAPPDAAGSQILHYTLGKVIGRGGFSTVRLATDNLSGDRYACRIIKRDDLSDQSGSLENFELELEIWADVSRVRCPSILPLLEQWRDAEGGWYATYLFSPYMARGSLLDVLRRQGGSEETARRWFPGIVAAVKALHRGWTGTDKEGNQAHAPGGFLHGDLKLDNFLVGERGEICVCDFGLTQRIAPGSSSSAAAAAAAAGGGEDERRGRREERRIILHSREASPERTIDPVSARFTSTGSRQPSRSRPRLHSPYVSTPELDFQHHYHHSHPAQHATRPPLPTFPTSNQILFDHRHHRSSTSRGKEVSPGPPRGRRTSRSRSRKPGGVNVTHIPVQTCFPSASLPYASPELLRAPPSPPDFAQDMWALGIILHALLTSRLPFVDAYDPRLQMKIIRGEWVVPPGLAAEWVECLRGCLEVDPRRRWDIDMLAASDAVQGWQEAKSRSKSRSRSRARSRGPNSAAAAGPRMDVSPTDPLIGKRAAVGASLAGDRPRARSRSRSRTDYFASGPGGVGIVPSLGINELPGTPRAGRTRSRSGASMFRDREQQASYHSHYDSPLELVPETDALQQQDISVPSSHHTIRPMVRSPGRSRSSQGRHAHNAFGTGLVSGLSRDWVDAADEGHPPGYAVPSSSSSRTISSSRSRSRDQGTSRYAAPLVGSGLSTSPILPMTLTSHKSTGDVPSPRRTSEGRDTSR